MGRASRGKAGKRPKTSKNWKRFERLTAALHALEMRGAKVTWDDHINGWQIDVSVRFESGPYRWLQVIACRDHQRRVEQEDMAALVTIVNETGANMGVFVSASGFQAGALELAAQRGIQTFKLSEVPSDWVPIVPKEIPLPSIVLTKVHVQGETGIWLPLADEVAATVRFQSPRDRMLNIGQVVNDTVMGAWDSLHEQHRLHVALRGRWLLHTPSILDVPRVVAVAALVQREVRMTPIMAVMPSEMRPLEYRYRNEQTGDEKVISADELPIGFDSIIKSGSYYRDIVGREYFCEDATSESIRFVLLGSVQHGIKMFAGFTCEPTSAEGKYTEVTAPQELKRLARLHKEWVDAVATGKTRRDGFVPDPDGGGSFLLPSRGKRP